MLAVIDARERQWNWCEWKNGIERFFLSKFPKQQQYIVQTRYCQQAAQFEVLFMSITLSMSYSNSSRIIIYAKGFKMNHDSWHSLKDHLTAFSAAGEEERTSKSENKANMYRSTHRRTHMYTRSSALWDCLFFSHQTFLR